MSGFDFTNPFELTQAELEGRKQAENFFKFLRDDVRGYKHAQMIGMVLKSESEKLGGL